MGGTVDEHSALFSSHLASSIIAIVAMRSGGTASNSETDGDN
jgi:hypothetical protein